MINDTYVIADNTALTENVFRMKLQGPVSDQIMPGQFVDIALPGFFLRRPISICDVEEDGIVIIYKVVGDGTKAMSEMKQGEQVDMLVGLGHGYDLEKAGEKPLLLGGGVGVPPMYYLAKSLKKQGKQVRVVLGFNTENEVFYEDAFKQLGCDVVVTTADGSYGVKGFVTNAMDCEYTSVCACGPLPMLKAVNRTAVTDGQYSFEERMGCGIGACMGCVMKDKDGNSLRVCKEGPVLSLEKEIL